MALPQIDFDSIPEEIKGHPNWILWKLKTKKNKEGKPEIDPKTGKPKKTKIPYQINGKWAKSNDPETWSPFETVKDIFLKSNGKYSGIGYVFDSKYGIIGIDYDDVYNPETGEWIDEEAFEDILYCASYAEFSQSKKGIHVLVKGELPEDSIDANKQGRRKNNREMYKGPQYFAFTGWKIEESPDEIKPNQEAINELFKKYYPEKEQEDNKNTSNKSANTVLRSPSLTDEQVLDKCRKDKRHKKFFKLYDLGEWQSFSEYPSHSEADLGLCDYIAFYTQDPEQIYRIFRKGKLYRSEWDRRGPGDIEKAISGLTTVWNPKDYKNNKEKAGEDKLSNRAREVLKLSFEKMLSNDSDKSTVKNGVGFNKFDSEAIHKEMDGETEVSDEILIKNASRLKKYKKQLVGFGIDTDELDSIIKEYNKKSKSAEPEKVNVPFDVVSDHVLNTRRIFSMRDNKQIYLYQDGVYRSEGIEAIIDTEIRNIYNDFYKEYWDSMNPDFPLGHIPKATTKYINEALAYIRAYSHRPRLDIDKEAGRYINLLNGLFDLEKWEKIEHTPEYLSICQTPVKYDPDAKCPQIEKFLSEVAKPEDIEFLYEWFGYCLTVDVKYQKALMVYGIPGTGKSVLLALLEIFIGIENCSAESLQKIEEDKYRAANVYGKRVNVCSDIPSTKMHKTEVFKKMVSGLDSIDAENKYQQPFKFRNVAKLAFSANKLPEGPKDPAFYERFCLIEFSQKFRGTDKDDKQLINKLTTEAELSGLLNKALEGLKRLYEKDKFSYSKSFEETEKEYLLNSNPVAVFMEECTEISDQDTDSTILYTTYIDWSKKNKQQFVSKIEFSRKLSKSGYTNHRDNAINTVTGRIDGSKKVILWDNIKIKTKSIGQDRGQDEENRSCPMKNDNGVNEKNTKTAIGQDPISFVDVKKKNQSFSCEDIETVKTEKNAKKENIENNKDTSCPKSRFFDSERIGQDLLSDPVLDHVQQAKITNLTENDVENYFNILQMRKDLTTFKNTCIRNNGGIESIEVFVGIFLKSMPGYLQLFSKQAIIFEASKICKVA